MALITAGAAGWRPFPRWRRLLRWPSAVGIAVAATFLAAIPVSVLASMLGTVPPDVTGTSFPAGVLLVAAIPAAAPARRIGPAAPDTVGTTVDKRFHVKPIGDAV